MRIHRKLNNCANVIKLFKIYEDENKLYLLLEYKSGGDLKDAIVNRRYITEGDAKIITA